jgi:Papain family cysteine protease
VEASAARSAALDAYQSFKFSSSSSSSSSSSPRHSSSSHNNDNSKIDIIKTSPAPPALRGDDHDKQAALTHARRVEYDAMKVLNLSIQELIDCDTSADEGCTGGNPILAFYFIHRYGLVSWEQYPYGMSIQESGRIPGYMNCINRVSFDVDVAVVVVVVATTAHTWIFFTHSILVLSLVAAEKSCKSEWTRHPLATVQSWGILTPNDETQMVLVLRYIGRSNHH